MIRGTRWHGWRVRLSAVCLILGVAAMAVATALDVKATGIKTFYINPRAGNSQVTVFSQSTLEDFTTVCNQVGGEWLFDPKNMESLHGRFSLKIKDLHTGIPLRDHDLYGPEWFDADKFPEIAIEVPKVEDVRKTEANTATLKLVGTCSIHGKTNPVSIPCTLTYLDESPLTQRLVKGDVVRMRAEFAFKLSDYGILGPPGSDTINVKVSDNQSVRVTIFGATEKPPQELHPDTQPATGGPPKLAPPPRPPGK
jgi:polyisoprenoid-binding protein YceI